MKKIIVLLLALQFSGCGYFLYPERKGLEGGKLDTTVVVLDAVALLFGVIPGVIAFAVDVSQGTIYLPSGQDSSLDKHLQSSVEIDGQNVELDTVQIAAELSEILGHPVEASDIEFYLSEDREALVLAQAN